MGSSEKEGKHPGTARSPESLLRPAPASNLMWGVLQPQVSPISSFSKLSSTEGGKTGENWGNPRREGAFERCGCTRLSSLAVAAAALFWPLQAPRPGEGGRAAGLRIVCGSPSFPCSRYHFGYKWHKSGLRHALCPVSFAS